MTTVNDMNHSNLVVVHFNAYAGGKFFINCLSHNPSVLPGLYVASPQHWHDQWVFYTEDKEQKKIDRIISTIPLDTDLHLWPSYELGCCYFWGNILPNLLTTPPSSESIRLLKNNICFIVNHNVTMQGFDRIRDQWPNARHIILHNTKQFQQVAVAFKSPGDQLNFSTIDLDIPDCFYLDVDNTYSDAAKIKKQVIDCLEWLGQDNNLHPALDQYIIRYLALHQ